MIEPDDVTDVALATMLRRLGHDLHARVPVDERRVAVAEHLAAAAELLADGEPRPRWYELPVEERDNPRLYRDVSTFSGLVNTVAPPMRIRPATLADGRPILVGTVRLDRRYEGPPRAVHGGILAGLFDELLGGGQRLTGGPPGMTGRLTVRYRRPTPLDTDLRFRAWIDDERERRVTVKADCGVVDPDADPDAGYEATAEAEAIFLRVDYEGLERNLRERADGAPAPAPRRESA